MFGFYRSYCAVIEAGGYILFYWELVKRPDSLLWMLLLCLFNMAAAVFSITRLDSFSARALVAVALP
jgi:hypothetical protein